MAKKTNKTEDQFAQVEEALTKTEQYIEDNQKNLIRIVGVIVGVIALVIGFQNLYIEPLEKEAQTDMYMAELYFQKDSFNLALNGDGQYLGFVDVADEYSWTKVGKLANYYAGLCYLHLGEYESAIEYLEDFSSDDVVLSTLALGCIGDAYMELGDTDNSLNSYEDAAYNSDNEFTKPIYMLKQAMIHEQNGDYDDALVIYNDIKLNFKTSREAYGIERYISRAENR
jgi:tetratricopeptide (TPR) repeat protein